jgi:dGTPase
MFSTHDLEIIEDYSLAPYGVRSKDSKGREFKDTEPAYRTAFQRELDRIMHTTAFRQLEYKTQVFINFEGDYFRTRLTHTLEVAQVGRTIARALGANEDLVETICLSHDLGHSPFGHAGEFTLKKIMKDHGGFDHNKQSLRIVTELEQHYPEFPGLNLSWETREGMVKHESEYDVLDAREYNPELRGNLETQICNVADELTYTSHDLDADLRSGMITLKMLESISLYELLTETINWSSLYMTDLERHHI